MAYIFFLGKRFWISPILFFENLAPSRFVIWNTKTKQKPVVFS